MQIEIGLFRPKQYVGYRILLLVYRHNCLCNNNNNIKYNYNNKNRVNVLKKLSTAFLRSVFFEKIRK